MKLKPAPPVDDAVECSDGVYMALKAMQAGNANADQQPLALRWIIEVVAATYDQPFRSGGDGNRDTAFACGRMFVGQQIVRWLNSPISPSKHKELIKAAAQRSRQQSK